MFFLKKDKLTLWMLLLICGLSSFCIFLSIPLLTIYSSQRLNLNSIEIGFVSAVWPLTTFIISTPAGILSDKFGYLKTIRFSLIVSSTAFLFLYFSFNIVSFAFSLFVFGVGKGFFDCSTKAGISSLCKLYEREKYFRIRYMLQNIGGIIGPIVGIWIYRVQGKEVFLLTSLVYFITFLVAMASLEKKDFKYLEQTVFMSFKDRIKIVKDMSLLYWIIGSSLILIAYGSYETFMPLITEESINARPEFALLLSINGFIALILQPLYFRYLSSFSLKRTSTIGFLVMTAGFLTYTINFKVYIMTIMATIIFSVGESLLFPCIDVLIDRIAPEKNKALYFGAGELKQIGFF